MSYGVPDECWEDCGNGVAIAFTRRDNAAYQAASQEEWAKHTHLADWINLERNNVINDYAALCLQVRQSRILGRTTT